MTMLEKIARALDPECWMDVFGADEAVIRKIRRDRALGQARAAVEVMMVPTPEMLEPAASEARRVAVSMAAAGQIPSAQIEHYADIGQLGFLRMHQAALAAILPPTDAKTEE